MPVGRRRLCGGLVEKKNRRTKQGKTLTLASAPLFKHGNQSISAHGPKACCKHCVNHRACLVNVSIINVSIKWIF